MPPGLKEKLHSHLRYPICHSAAPAPLRTSEHQDRPNWDPCFPKALAPWDKKIFISCSLYGDNEPIKELQLHAAGPECECTPKITQFKTCKTPSALDSADIGAGSVGSFMAVWFYWTAHAHNRLLTLSFRGFPEWRICLNIIFGGFFLFQCNSSQIKKIQMMDGKHCILQKASCVRKPSLVFISGRIPIPFLVFAIELLRRYCSKILTVGNKFE